MYSRMDLPLVDLVSVLVWRVLSVGGYWVMWHVVLLWWPGSIVGWFHWPSAHRSVSPVVVELACKMTSNRFFFFPLLYVFNNCMVCYEFQYLCLLLRMCDAYAEIGLFVLIYLVCSCCHISFNLPFWPTYDLLHIWRL